MDKSKKILNKKINLIPEYIVQEKKSKDKYYLLLLCVLIPVFAMSMLTGRYLTEYLALSRVNVNNNQRILELIPIIKREEKIKTREDYVILKSQYQKNIDKSNSNIIEMLALVERARPTDLYLTNITDTQTQNEKLITITGFSISKEYISLFEQSLRNAGIFDNVFIPELRQSKLSSNNNAGLESGTEVYEFTVSCIFVENKGE